MGWLPPKTFDGPRTKKLRSAILGAAGLLFFAPGIQAAPPAAPEGTVTVDLAQATSTNIPNLAEVIKKGRFVFRRPGASEETFSVQFPFHITTTGEYIPAFSGRGPGMRTQSRYSYAIDGGSAREALSRRVALPTDGRGYGWQEQPPVTLKEGDHVLELRFQPSQQVHLLNRVNEPLDGHAVEIEGIRFTPVPPPPAAKPAPRADNHFLWKNGDTIVFFGDSITDEGFYLQPLTRLLQAAFPTESFTCINSGIALNRTWEGVERLDRDVLALRPNWTVLAFGVNDAMHMAPDEFKTNYEKIVDRLRAAKVGVICATPSGMLPALGTDQKAYFHAPDRASGFDRSMAYDAAVVQGVAAEHKLPVADVLGAFLGLGAGRAAVMTNQWHPNQEGGRLMALAILRAAGFSEADVAKSGDPRDLEVYRQLEKEKTPPYEAYAPRSFRAPDWPKGPLVAATSFSRNEVILADEATGAEVARVPVGCHPMGLAYSPKRRALYIASEGSGQIDVLRLPECRLEKPIALGDVYPVAVALSEDGNTAWTANFFGTSIAEIDLETGKVRRVTKVGDLAESLVYLPELKRLLVATHAGIKLVDPEKGVVENTLKLSDHHDAFWQAPDGKWYAIDTVNWTKTALELPALTAGATEPCAWPGRASAARVGGAPGRWVADFAKGGLVRIEDGEKNPVRVPGVDHSFGIVTIPQE